MADNIQNKLLGLLLGVSESEEITNLKRALAAAIEKAEMPQKPPEFSLEIQTKRLRDNHERLLVENKFKPGQFVKWKEGLRNRTIPAPNQAAIVITVLDVPVFDENKNSFTPGFREPLDICIGVLGPLGDTIPYWLNSQRLESAD